MPETVRPVQTVVIDYICDECGEGRMRRHGNMVLTSDPIQFPHKCDKCGSVQNFTDMPYPRTGYREIEPDADARLAVTEVG